MPLLHAKTRELQSITVEAVGSNVGKDIGIALVDFVVASERYQAS